MHAGTLMALMMAGSLLLSQLHWTLLRRPVFFMETSSPQAFCHGSLWFDSLSLSLSVRLSLSLSVYLSPLTYLSPVFLFLPPRS